MKTLTLADTLNDERLAPFLPMLSAVWADGELTDLEIAAVCMELTRRPEIDLSCKEALQHWLDPDNPPTADDLMSLRSRIRRSGKAASLRRCGRSPMPHQRTPPSTTARPGHFTTPVDPEAA